MRHYIISNEKVECICRCKNLDLEEIQKMIYYYHMDSRGIYIQNIAKKLGIKNPEAILAINPTNHLNRSVLVVAPTVSSASKFEKIQKSFASMLYEFVKVIDGGYLSTKDPQSFIDTVVTTSCEEGIPNVYIDFTIANNVFGAKGLLPYLIPDIRWLIPTYDMTNEDTIPLTEVIIQHQHHINKEVYL